MIKFITGGWRAVIGDEFTRENVSLIAQGLANYVNEEKLNDKPIIIGGDRRFLSSDACNWVAEVLSVNNLNVIMLNRSAQTPFVMHYVKKNNLNFGIEITASHSLSQYNGIKIFVKEGRDAPIEITDAIEKYIASIKEILSIALPNERIMGCTERLKITYLAR